MAAAAIVVLWVVQTTSGIGGSVLRDSLRDLGAPALFAIAAAIVVAQGLRAGRDRLAWLLLGAGIASTGAGTIVYLLFADGGAEAPIAAHVLWSAFYPLAYVSLVLLLRARVQPLPRSLWIDGLIGALTLSSLLSAFVFPPLMEQFGGDPLQVAAYLVYPVLDVLLLALALVVMSLTGWRPGRSWLLLVAGFALALVGDSALAFEGATATIEDGTLLSAGFPLGMIVVALASTSTPRAVRRQPGDRVTRLLFPGICVVISVALSTIDQFVELSNDRVVLPLAVIALAGVRAAATIADLRRLYESQRFERGFEDATIGMALISADLRWIRVNRALASLLGRSPEELIGRSTLDVVHPEDRGLTLERRDGAVAGQVPRSRDMRVVRADGLVTHVSTTVSLVDSDPSSESYFFAQIQDVGDRHRAAARQAAITTLGHLALEATDVRPLTQEAVRLVAQTMQLELASLLRLTPDGSAFRFEAWASPRVPYDLTLPAGTGSQVGYTLLCDGPVIANDLTAESRFAVPPSAVAAGMVRGMSVPVRRRSGTTHALIVHESDPGGSFSDDDVRFLEAVANVLASAIDRMDADDELRRRALEDPLTGLANRALLASQLEHALHGAKRHGGEVTVLLLDLDRFKYVNDTLGHGAGDELLREVGLRLSAEMRDEDVVARLGGDEFVVVCTEPSGEAAIAEVAQRVVDVLGQPFAVNGRELFVSASVGVAVGGATASAEGLLSDADSAMYRAKEQGGARYEVFDAELRARLVQRVSTEAALRRALERDELELRYQPIVELRTGRVTAFEALLRWHHPDRGLVSPAEFVPIAEETDLIVPIGRWVLRTACKQAAEWSAGRGTDRLGISVNLSPRQVTPALVDEVELALVESALAPELLTLEITESLLLEQASTIGVISALRALGASVSLDDFGSGYSSLSYLQSYPLDVVKLDRGFVETLDESDASAAVVKAAIEMAGALGLAVVAEGVEREEQRVRLCELGCPFAQGYLFAPALAPDDAAELIRGADFAAA